MHRRRLVGGLTVAFGAMSALLAVGGVLGNPILLVLSAFFLVVTGLMYYQASGRLAERVYRRVERQANVRGGRRRRRRRRQAEEQGSAGFGAGPREEWTGPHRREGRQRVGQAAGQGARGAGGGQRRQGQQGRQRQRRQRPPTATGRQEVTAREAYDVLGLDPGADQDAIRSAYRERVKEAHPDAETGDQETFRRVRTAYERLAE